MSLLLLFRPQRALVVKGAARLQGLDFNGERVEHTSTRPSQVSVNRPAQTASGRPSNISTSRR